VLDDLKRKTSFDMPASVEFEFSLTSRVQRATHLGDGAKQRRRAKSNAHGKQIKPANITSPDTTDKYYPFSPVRAIRIVNGRDLRRFRDIFVYRILEIGNGFSELLGYKDLFPRLFIDGHGNDLSRANRAVAHLFVNREFKGKAGISDIADAHVNVQGLIEERTTLVLAVGRDVEKIRSRRDEIAVGKPDGPEVFDQSNVEVGEIMAEENMSLHVRLNVSNLYGVKKLCPVLHCSPSLSGCPLPATTVAGFVMQDDRSGYL
jgi:hypothetical protein